MFMRPNANNFCLSGLHCLAFVDPEAKWFSKWMTGKLGRKHLVSVLGSMNVVPELVSGVISYSAADRRPATSSMGTKENVEYLLFLQHLSLVSTLLMYTAGRSIFPIRISTATDSKICHYELCITSIATHMKISNQYLAGLADDLRLPEFCGDRLSKVFESGILEHASISSADSIANSIIPLIEYLIFHERSINGHAVVRLLNAIASSDHGKNWLLSQKFKPVLKGLSSLVGKKVELGALNMADALGFFALLSKTNDILEPFSLPSAVMKGRKIHGENEYVDFLSIIAKSPKGFTSLIKSDALRISVNSIKLDRSSNLDAKDKYFDVLGMLAISDEGVHLLHKWKSTAISSFWEMLRGLADHSLQTGQFNDFQLRIIRQVNVLFSSFTSVYCSLEDSKPSSHSLNTLIDLSLGDNKEFKCDMYNESRTVRLELLIHLLTSLDIQAYLQQKCNIIDRIKIMREQVLTETRIVIFT